MWETTVPRARGARPIDRDADDRLHAHQGAPLGLGRKKGEQKQAIGRSRGGRNTKIHAIADAKGRLLSILLTGGEAHDCPPAQRLIRRTKAAREAARRQGLRQRRAAAMAEGSRHQARHSQQVEPQAAVQLRQEILQTATPHRECLLPPQGLPPHRHPLRQAGAETSSPPSASSLLSSGGFYGERAHPNPCRGGQDRRPGRPARSVITSRCLPCCALREIFLNQSPLLSSALPKCCVSGVNGEDARGWPPEKRASPSDL